MRTLLGFRTLPFGTILLAASTSLCAQSADTSSALMRQQPASQNCPVALRADRLPGGFLSRAAEAKRPDGTPLHISFKPEEPHAVIRAELVLHGIAGTHVVPAGDHPGSAATEVFSVTPAQASHHLFDTVVYLRKLTAVEYLEVKSISFADGTVWHPSASSTCRVAPDGFMLVAAGE